MATKYAVVSGAWSSTATWSNTDGGAGGAAVPAGGDAVVISAGVSVLMDVNQSAFVTGIAGVTIRGAAVTPGMLYFKDGTNGYLRLKTNTNINGVNATTYGRILANSDGVWGNTGELSPDNYAIMHGDGSVITATYLNVKLYCHQPTVPYLSNYGIRINCTADLATSTFSTSTAHGFANNAVVTLRVAGGSLPEPLRENSNYLIYSQTTTTFQLRYRSNGGFIPLTSSGSGTFEIIGGHLATNTPTINVIEDVSADTDWTNAADKNRVVLANRNTYDIQNLTISSISSTSVTLSANINSVQHPCSLIILAYRNVQLKTTSTSDAARMYYGPKNGDVLNCEIYSLGNAGTGVSANPWNTDVNIGAIIHNVGVGSNSHKATMSGIMTAMTTGFSSPGDVGINGLIIGVTSACSSVSSITNSTGKIYGCTTAFNSCKASTFSLPTIRGVNTVFASPTSLLCSNVDVNFIGTLVNGNGFTAFTNGLIEGVTGYLVQSSTLTVLSGLKICGCNSFTLQSHVKCYSSLLSDIGLNFLMSGILELNHTVVSLLGAGACTESIGRIYNVTLPNPVSVPKGYDHNISMIYFDESYAGQIRGWNNGGTIITETYAVGTHGTPPASLSYVYKNTFAAAYSNGIDIQLMGRKNVPTRIKVYVKKSTATMTTSPYAKLCDPSYGFEMAGEQLDIDTAADNTIWQTLVVEYTPTYDKPLVLRVAGVNASGYFYWNWEQCSSSSWGNTLLGG